MRAPYTQLFLHLVWATWDRYPYLEEPLRTQVYACIQEERGKLEAEMIAIGGVADHVHLPARAPATVSPASLVKQVKGASSHLVNQVIHLSFFFKWQGGYGAFSVSKTAVGRVRSYILRQEEHHRDGTTFPEVELE